MAAADPVAVASFTPQGEAKQVRQVAARFASPMVPFGDPRELAPFDVDCPAGGQGRWVDATTWVYDFERDLPAGIRCTFALKEGLVALDGTAVQSGRRFEFSTGGPAVVRSLPDEGSRIDEAQVFVLGLDAPVRAETIAAHAYCSAAGIRERIGVRMVTGAERRTILDARKRFAASYLRAVLLDERAGRSRAFLFRLPDVDSDEAKFRALRDAPDSPLVTLACARTLPAGAAVKLVWGDGIAATTGIATSSEQALAFEVRPAFRASFSCARVSKDAQCLTLRPFTLAFTAPVPARVASRIRLVDASGRLIFAKLPKSRDATVDQVTFGPGLPERQTFRLEVPLDLRDDAGRPLANAASFPLRVVTDELPPLAKFPAEFGILESVLPHGEKPLLPLTVRNVEAELGGNVATLAHEPEARAQPIAGAIARVGPGEEMKIVDWLRRVERGARIEREYDQKTEQWRTLRHGGASSIFTAADRTRRLAVPKPGGARAFEVLGIPLDGPGFYVVELASPRLGAALLEQKKPYYVRTAALVTNLGVHLKLGRESSLVWVTRLSDAQPVAAADVVVRDCSGRVHWQGRSDASGIARVERALPSRDDLPKCIDQRREYFVTARDAGDLAFAFSDWGQGIAPWRFNVPTAGEGGAFAAHAVLDRNLVRTGETVSMKLVVRRQTSSGFAFVARNALAGSIVVRHAASNRKFDVPVRWHETDYGEAAFAVPADAPLGVYEIVLRDTLSGGREQERTAGTFRVEAFRVPLVRARLQPLGAPLVRPAEVAFDLQLDYLAGGPAGGLPVRLRTQQQPRIPSFADFEDFHFAAGNVRVGRDEQGDAFDTFDVASDQDAADDDSGARTRGAAARVGTTEQTLSLDGAGGARAVVKDVGRDAAATDTVRELVAELEYRDPNGETLTASTRVPLYPARVLLGIKVDGWAASRERVRFAVAAVDLAGHPLPGVRVGVDAFKREYYSHRRRLIGGFYAYEHGSETSALGGGELCAAETNSQGLLLCEVKPPATGNLVLRAQAKDGDGQLAVTRADAWVAGDEEWWFEASDNDRIDLIPEKKRYEPGDTARFQVRSPFAQATVLVTVEREGVLDAFVRTLSRKEATIEVPMRGSYAPNVFVSAFLVRGRIGNVAPTAMLDLAKPSYKMGLAEVRVGWAAHELKVKVTPAQTTYRPRATAKVAIAVRNPDGSAPARGTGVAIAAVDEGLLELLPNGSWKLLDAMMQRRGEEVQTATAQMQVVGRRHFGRKAVAAGGGGGRQSARELFDTLLYWKAHVPVDAAGDARVEIPLNDSLTGFRIVAVAHAGASRFGSGEATIRSTQELMLQSGLPSVVRSGDRFRAGVTLRNASPSGMHARVTPQVAGVALPTQELDLAAGEARELGWDVAVPAGAARLDWLVSAVASAGDGSEVARDTLKVSQRVIAAVPERTVQATLLQLDAPVSLDVQRPADALPDRGGVRVSLQARLGGDLPGVREWLERYPYTCFEQQVSVAVGLQDRVRWDAAMRSLPAFLDRDGLVRFFTLLRDGDDTLTAHVLAVADAAGWPIPDESRRRMIEGLRGFLDGRVVRYTALPTADLALRKLAAMAALASEREVFTATWLDAITIAPKLWPTSALIDWQRVLKHQRALPQREARLREVETLLRARLNVQGTTLTFSTERTDALWWLLVSGDVNANRLLLAVMDEPAWRSDVPRLARGALGRMQRGHWNTTVANAWGVLALRRFGELYEREPVTGTSTASIATERGTFAWNDADPPPVQLGWPGARETLSLRHDGGGSPWATVQSVAAIPLTAPLSSGYRVARSVTPVQQKVAGRWSRGDVARVRLEIDAQSDMTWVVVSDPIPAGATVLGRGLGGDSALSTRGERRQGVAWLAFEERTFEAYRAYYRVVPKGTFAVEYTVRLNNPGAFGLGATRVEAMYAPEMFGEAPNAPWSIAP